jgi:protein phosphatase
MALAELFTATLAPSPSPKPRDDELDLFGLTHPGLVRRNNQDHFLIGTIHPQAVIHGTSLTDADKLLLRGERFGTVLMVADGVGGGSAGAEASQLAVATIARYLSSMLRSYEVGSQAEGLKFLATLRAGVLEAHDAVKAEAATRPGVRSMATTLTLAIAVWPFLYVVQVGDSRCYVWADGKLTQITRDQTVAQDLVDRGALKPHEARASPLSHVLASSIGGSEAAPEVSRHDITRKGLRVLLCSDGLTKHLTNDEIAERCASGATSEELCRGLLDQALQRGGEDNITILSGRRRPPRT